MGNDHKLPEFVIWSIEPEKTEIGVVIDLLNIRGVWLWYEDLGIVVFFRFIIKPNILLPFFMYYLAVVMLGNPNIYNWFCFKVERECKLLK